MAVINDRRSIQLLAVAVMARKSPRQQCLQCSGKALAPSHPEVVGGGQPHGQEMVGGTASLGECGRTILHWCSLFSIAYYEKLIPQLRFNTVITITTRVRKIKHVTTLAVQNTS